jgi:IclR family transcriptional regulator, pca regulon regulatory protein
MQTQYRTAMQPAPKSADLIDGLTKGIAVMNAFTREQPQHTASSLAATIDMSRAAARRFLITLEHLGFAATDGRVYWLTPKMLSFSALYHAAEQTVRTVEPHLQALAQRTGEAVSFGVIDGQDVLYLARATGSRMLSTNIVPGTRLPLQCAAAGWAMMAHWSSAQFHEWLREVKLQKYTPQNVTDKRLLEKRLIDIQESGYALLEDQFEIGMRGLSAAVINAAGKPVGGITIAMATSVCTTRESQARYGAPLKEAAQRLSRYL